jgi:hypothetical protein
MTTDHRPPTTGKFPFLIECGEFAGGRWSMVGGHFRKQIF